MGDMSGKVAVITGAGSGLGQATAAAFAAAGASVVVADVSMDGLDETVAIVEEGAGAVSAVRCDVTVEGEVQAMVQHAVSTFGGLDYAYNNAGIEGHQMPVTDLTDEEFRRVLDVNVMGVFYGMKHEIPAMLDRGGGVIVNASSTAGLRGYANLMPYVASKHAVAGMTKTAALEYADQGVRVLSIHPAAIETPMVARAMADSQRLADAIASMHPIGRVGQPREVADVVVFLCSPGASFMTGTQLVIDGGALSHG
jgi:NAD(P)-dependent dehydrogenase (short-subunit alcohol dehydrogenase family)